MTTPQNHVVQVSVSRIRADEGGLLRAVRLAALKDSPTAFSSSLELEAARADAEWETRAVLGASGNTKATFLARTNGDISGLVGAYRQTPDDTTIQLVSMWTAPELRRRGLGRALVTAVVDWAQEIAAARIDLWVVSGNDPAHGLYKAMGFNESGQLQPLAFDTSRDEVHMTRTM